MSEPPSLLDRIFDEVERRGLIPAAGVYAVVSWFGVQMVATVSSILELPDWVFRAAVALFFAGLPMVLGIAWILGAPVATEAEEGVDRPSPARLSPASGWPNTVLVVVLFLAGGGLWAYRTYGAASPTAAPDDLRPKLEELSPRAIAVLPFDNVSGDPDQAYFSDGITEEIRNALTRAPDLRVVSRSSSFRFRDSDADLREIAVELGVGSVLEGAVRRVGERVRVSTELVDARTDTRIWGRTFEGSLPNVFALEDSVARAVARALEVRLVRRTEGGDPPGRPLDIEAYELYLLGLHHWNRRNGPELRRAVELFARAAERDPEYALAWAGLASARVLLPLYAGVPAAEAMPEAEAAARRALALDSTLAEAHATLGFVRTTYQWNAGAAETRFRRAIELNPSYATAHQWYGLLLDAVGRHDRALEEIRKALDLDPLSLIINQVLGDHYLWTREYERAEAQLLRTLEMEPAFPLALDFLGETYLLMGRWDDAREVLVRRARILDRDTARVVTVVEGIADPSRREAAVEALDRAPESGRPGAYERARLFALLGARERAVDELERGWETRDFLMFIVGIDPAFDALRDEPRFRELLERMGLT